MDDNKKTIGLTDLLNEVAQDLDDFRKKHAGDYQIKNITMWWELEKERLVTRHGSDAQVKKLRRMFRPRNWIYFFAGWLMMIGAQLVLRVIIG